MLLKHKICEAFNRIVTVQECDATMMLWKTNAGYKINLRILTLNSSPLLVAWPTTFKIYFVRWNSRSWKS